MFWFSATRRLMLINSGVITCTLEANKSGHTAVVYNTFHKRPIRKKTVVNTKLADESTRVEMMQSERTCIKIIALSQNATNNSSTTTSKFNSQKEFFTRHLTPPLFLLQMYKYKTNGVSLAGKCQVCINSLCLKPGMYLAYSK